MDWPGIVVRDHRRATGDVRVAENADGQGKNGGPKCRELELQQIEQDRVVCRPKCDVMLGLSSCMLSNKLGGEAIFILNQAP